MGVLVVPHDSPEPGPGEGARRDRARTSGMDLVSVLGVKCHRRRGAAALEQVIREEIATDRGAIRDVQRLAFGQEDEGRLVDALRAGGFARVSLGVHWPTDALGGLALGVFWLCVTALVLGRFSSRWADPQTVKR